MLQDVPLAATVHPTAEEFADPLKYIESIRHLGEQYGIVSIVPPAGWDPPFALHPTAAGGKEDVGALRFRVRKQFTSHLCMRPPASAHQGDGRGKGGSTETAPSRMMGGGSRMGGGGGRMGGGGGRMGGGGGGVEGAGQWPAPASAPAEVKPEPTGVVPASHAHQQAAADAAPSAAPAAAGPASGAPAAVPAVGVASPNSLVCVPATSTSARVPPCVVSQAAKLAAARCAASGDGSPVAGGEASAEMECDPQGIGAALGGGVASGGSVALIGASGVAAAEADAQLQALASSAVLRSASGRLTVPLVPPGAARPGMPAAVVVAAELQGGGSAQEREGGAGASAARAAGVGQGALGRQSVRLAHKGKRPCMNESDGDTDYSDGSGGDDGDGAAAASGRQVAPRAAEASVCAAASPPGVKGASRGRGRAMVKHEEGDGSDVGAGDGAEDGGGSSSDDELKGEFGHGLHARTHTLRSFMAYAEWCRAQHFGLLPGPEAPDAVRRAAGRGSWVPANWQPGRNMRGGKKAGAGEDDAGAEGGGGGSGKAGARRARQPSAAAAAAASARKEPSTDELEAEFWRLVEAPERMVETLYGSDLDSGR